MFYKIQSILPGLIKNKVLILSFFVVILSILDSSIVNFFGMYHINGNIILFKSLFLCIILFISLLIYMCSNLVKKSLVNFKTEIKSEIFFLNFFKYVQIPLVALLITTLALVEIFNFYKVYFLYGVILIAHVSGLFYFTWFIIKSLNWFLNSRNIFVLLYISSFIVFSTFILFSLINYTFNLTHLFKDVTYIPYYQLKHTIGLALTNWQITSTHFVLLFLSFLSMWVTTSLLLNQYIRKKNKTYFWSLISLPLIYYIIQFLFIELDYLSSIILIDPFNNLIVYEFLFVFSTPLVGIIFGISMLFISKKFAIKEIRNNLIMLSIGFMLLFCSFQPNSLLYKPFPPFGISIVLMSVGAFMIIVSLYQIIFIVAKNIAISKELINIMGKQNLFIYFSEGKKIHELTNMVNQINHSVSVSQFDTENEPKDMSKEEINDILEFIKEELEKSNHS